MKSRLTISYRLSRLLPAALALATLAGCQSAPPAGRPATTAAPVVAPSAGQASSSPALAFVARGRPGQSTTVTDAAYGGTVVVEIEAQYHSASNRTCRRFAVSRPKPPARRQTRYACFTAAGLKLVDIY